MFCASLQVSSKYPVSSPPGSSGALAGEPAAALNWICPRGSASGRSGLRRSVPGGNYPATPIPPTRSAPEPVAAAPDAWAAWHEALAALGPADGPDVRGMPDGRLLHLRDTYPIETA